MGLAKNIFSKDTVQKSTRTIFKVLSVFLILIFGITLSIGIALFLCGLIDDKYNVNKIISVFAFSCFFLSFFFLYLYIKVKKKSEKAYTVIRPYKVLYKKCRKLIKNISKDPLIKAQNQTLLAHLLLFSREVKQVGNDLNGLYHKIDQPMFDYYLVERRLLLENKKQKVHEKKRVFLENQLNKLTLFENFMTILKEEIQNAGTQISRLETSLSNKNSRLESDSLTALFSGFMINMKNHGLTFFTKMEELNGKKIKIKEDSPRIFAGVKKAISPDKLFYGWRPSFSALFSLIFSLATLFLIGFGIWVLLILIPNIPMGLMALGYMPGQAVNAIAQIIPQIITIYLSLLQFLILATLILSLLSGLFINHNAGLLKGIFFSTMGTRIVVAACILSWIFFLIILTLGYSIFSTFVLQ